MKGERGEGMASTADSSLRNTYLQEPVTTISRRRTEMGSGGKIRTRSWSETIVN